MLHKEPSEGKKSKPRGRPFTKGHKRGKPKDAILDASRRESGDKGGIVTPPPQLAGLDALKQSFDETDNNMKEALRKILENHPAMGVIEAEAQAEDAGADSPREIIITLDEAKATPSENIVIDSIEFTREKDTLKIVLSKRHNRMFRIQIFLNETTEIRPVTYTGSNTAISFWNLLKGTLKK